jgi:hypothetical protein
MGRVIINMAIYTMKQATALSGLKRTTILHHLHRNRFAYQRLRAVGNPLRIDVASFQAFLEAYRAGAFKAGGYRRKNAERSAQA